MKTYRWKCVAHFSWGLVYCWTSFNTITGLETIVMWINKYIDVFLSSPLCLLLLVSHWTAFIKSLKQWCSMCSKMIDMLCLTLKAMSFEILRVFWCLWKTKSCQKCLKGTFAACSYGSHLSILFLWVHDFSNIVEKT